MKNAKIDTVIFDLDGTLLDTLDDLTASVNYCMDKYGYPAYDRSQVRAMVGNGIYVLMERALPGGAKDPFYPASINDFPEYYKQHLLDQTKPFSGILPMLQTLNEKHYKLAIVSNKFDAAVKSLNQDFFSQYISVAIGESPEISKKPAPDTVLQAMKELDVLPDTCIYVGDSEVDIQTAANANIPCISVTWGFKTTEFLKSCGASCIVSSPTELLEEICNRS